MAVAMAMAMARGRVRVTYGGSPPKERGSDRVRVRLSTFH